ncbi:hypothetical protein SI65_06355 [Aspergillus cristatus]|uniref:Uncharacterized protein n=1 Tax=Aspergillus cristatus TaxID=573508 RepID=A0A1E3BC21_ASPCR|nr:hypothetical protein SI65_06355 [Aspergillus cristatus]
MQDRLIPLLREVERVVTAPYVPSLQDLYGIVCNVSFPAIGSWSFCKPCQVAALVDVLVDGLSYSNVALELIGVFASVAAFRDALLERYPAILDQFLQKAVETEESKYLSTCTALLSSPLPSGFTAPARLAGLITKLVHHMAKCPNADTIRPINKLLTGLQTSPGTLYDIPAETMSTLQGELLKTLRNMDDHMGNLLCLSTFACITSSQKLDYEHEHGPQPPSWLHNVRHFFGPKRGLKTLDLVVLRVILACSANCNNLTPSEAAESVRLAIAVCDTVEPEQKQVWISGNASKIAKLCEKVTREGINYEVQMMGVMFLISLLPTNTLPPQILALGLQGLLSNDSLQVLEAIPLGLIPRLVEANAIISGKSTFHDSLNYVLSALKSPAPEMNTIQIATLILSGLQISEPHLSSASHALVRDSMGELIESFPRSPRQSQCNESKTCYAALSTAENGLLIDLFDLYYCASMSQNVEDGGARRVEAGLISKFTARVKNTACESNCLLATVKPSDARDKLSYLEPRQVSSNPRRDWKAEVSNTLMSSARTSYDGLMKKVEEVCRDLEHRCYNLEAPLRVIEEERNKASSEAEKLRQQNFELETRLQQAFSTINDLQQNMSYLEGHAEAASTRVEKLSTSLEAAQKELEDQRCAYEESSQAEKEKARMKELDFMATLTEKEDLLEELQAENHEQRAENEKLRKTLDLVSKDNGSTLETVASLRKEVSRLEEFSVSNQQLAAQKDEEISRLVASKEQMSSEIENLQQKLENEISGSDRLRNTLRDAEEHFESETDTLTKQHEMQLSEASAENAKQREDNKALHESMQTAASNAAVELQTKDKRIRHLERKIQSLRDERAAKAREFSVAQEHIGRLMTVMGFKPDSETKSSSKQQRSRSTLEPTQITPVQRAINPDDDGTQSQADHLFGDSFGFETPNPNGRSPKRPRGNSIPLDLTPAPRNRNHDPTPKGLPSRSHTSLPQRERRPLHDVDENSQAASQRTPRPSQAQSQFLESQVDINRNKLQELDLDMDVEFTKDFLFTSTSLSDANDPASP